MPHTLQRIPGCTSPRRAQGSLADVVLSILAWNKKAPAVGCKSTEEALQRRVGAREVEDLDIGERLEVEGEPGRYARGY